MTNAAPIIKDSDVANLANLSRISLTDLEISKFTKDLQSIISFIDVINNTEVSDELLKQDGFAPTNKTREDIVVDTEYMSAEDIVATAPNHQGNAIKVKKIIGGDE